MAEPTKTIGRTPLQAGGKEDQLPDSAAAGSVAGIAQQSGNGPPSYYDISLLKAPVWKWEIAGYFFAGGISGGAYLLGRVADSFARGRSPDLKSAAAGTAFVAALPCAPFLIRDLGDPKRFHYMLRIFKPSSPMSLGTWTLTAFSALAAVGAVREVTDSSTALATITRHPLVRVVESAAGIPLALLLVGYTGVLLSCTANPLWCKSHWLGPLFSASAIANSASAISLVLECQGSREKGSKKFLTDVASVSHAAELITLGAYKRERGALANPLKQGKYGGMITIATAGLLASEVLKRLPLRGRARTLASIAGSVAGLLAGLALRTAIVYGGQQAANSPELARLATAAG